MLLCRYAKRKFAGKYEVKRTMDKVQNSARSARMMNDEGRLALVETICAQRSELFIRTRLIFCGKLNAFGVKSEPAEKSMRDRN